MEFSTAIYYPLNTTKPDHISPKEPQKRTHPLPDFNTKSHHQIETKSEPKNKRTTQFIIPPKIKYPSTHFWFLVQPRNATKNQKITTKQDPNDQTTHKSNKNEAPTS
jgi:hypothetical protein